MTESVVQDSPLKQLLDRMVAAKQLSSIDAKSLATMQPPVQSEEDVLRWLAQEYGLAFTTLDDVDPDRQLLSLFPARILLKEELLPLKRLNGTVEVATSRLFATQGLDALKTMTGLNLKPVLASSEAIQREMKKRLGVGADTIGTLDEEKGFQVVDENAEDNESGRSRRGRGLDHPLRQPGVEGRHRTARVGHSSRTVRGRIPHPLPH